MLIERRSFPTQRGTGYPLRPCIRPYSIEPVLASMWIPLPNRDTENVMSEVEVFAFQMMAVFEGGLNAWRRRVHRWRHKGLTSQEADWIATALGEHPSSFWPTWWADD